MNSSPLPQSRQPRAEKLLFPIAVIVAAVAPFLGMFPPFSSQSTLPGAEAGPLEPFSVQDYRALFPPDRSYRRVAQISYTLEHRISDNAWIAHASHLALNALAAFLVYRLLCGLLRDAPIAALGAGVYAVLPIHTEAVATMAGRADLLGGVAVFLTWLLALRSSASRRDGAEAAGWVLAASLIAFLGLFSNENVLAVLPLILVGCWLLRIPVPWITFSSLVTAAAAYLISRQVVGANSAPGPAMVQNPLTSVGAGLRFLNATGNLSYFLAKTIVPWNLSADYSYQQIPVLGFGARAWAGALAVGAPLLLVFCLCRRRIPLASLSIFFFLLTLLPGSNFFFPAAAIFSERTAYTASFAYVLFLGALSQAARGRWRVTAVGALCILFALYLARTWERSQAWASPISMAIQMSKDSPKSVWSHLKAAEAHVKLAERDSSPARKKQHWATAEEELQKSLEIHPAYGRAEELYAKILLGEGRYAEAAERLTKAGRLLAQETPPELEPSVFRLRGECYLREGKAERAYEDFDLFIRLFQHLEGPPDALAFSRRGQARAEMGKLEEALEDFNTAIALRADLPDLWNNRGFCRFSLKDAKGAMEDYQRGMELCRKKGILYRPLEDSVWSFLLKIAEVERWRGQEGAARKWEAEAERVKADTKAP